MTIFGALEPCIAPRATVGALAVVGGLGNTSLMGLPMIEAFYGPDGMPVGIVIDQLGTCLVLSTIGILLICFYAEATLTRRDIIRRIVTFPPLLALVAAALLMPVTYPGWVLSILASLGAWRGKQAARALSVGYKLVLGRPLVLLLYVGGLGLRGSTTQITLFEAAMGPQIGGFILAIQYGLNAKLISWVVGVGTVLSFITIPCWWAYLQSLGAG